MIPSAILTGLLSSIENTYDPNFVVMSNQTPKEWLFDGKSFFLSRVSKMMRLLSNKKCILLWLCNGTDKVKVMSDSDCYHNRRKTPLFRAGDIRHPRKYIEIPYLHRMSTIF